MESLVSVTLQLKEMDGISVIYVFALMEEAAFGLFHYVALNDDIVCEKYFLYSVSEVFSLLRNH